MTSTKKPTITITEAALHALRDVMGRGEVGDNEMLRLTIDSRYQNDLFFGPEEPGDVVVDASGIPLAMDAGSARRADGLTIDYVEGRGGPAFKLENPNLSPPVKGIRAADLVRLLGSGEALTFIDVRSDDERKKARLDEPRPLDAKFERELLAMPKTSKLIFLGHHSRDGQGVARRFYDLGFSNVWYVVGGMDGWSTMDPSVPRY